MFYQVLNFSASPRNLKPDKTPLLVTFIRRYLNSPWVTSRKDMWNMVAKREEVMGLAKAGALTFNNYWMRLSMVAKFFKAEVYVIYRNSVKAEADNINQGLDNN